MIRKVFNSFVFAWNGLKTTWKEEINFRIEILVSIVIIFCAFYFKFVIGEMLFCILSVVMVLSAEILNTAVEDVCNKIEPNQDPTIGKIKDIMAGFVLVTVIAAITITLIIFYHHFF